MDEIKRDIMFINNLDYNYIQHIIGYSLAKNIIILFYFK
jgi:hypothetical protein